MSSREASERKLGKTVSDLRSLVRAPCPLLIDSQTKSEKLSILGRQHHEISSTVKGILGLLVNLKHRPP